MKLFSPIIALITVLVVLLPQSAGAAGIQFYEITSEILDNGMAKNQVKITFDYPSPAKLEYPVIGDAKDFSWSSTFNASCELVKQGATSNIQCDLTNINESQRGLIFDYTTSDFVRALDQNRWIFRYDYQSSVPVTALAVIVKLPEGKGLIKADDTQTAGGLLPYAPADGDTRTDGRRILIDWVRNDFMPGDLLGISVVYENIQEDALSEYLPMIIALIVILTGITIYFYLKKDKIIIRTEETLESILPVLTEDERKVINCLLGNNGEIMQRKIVTDTNFSKAKVSRLISDLKHRGIIGVEEKGRTNRIFLIKKPKEPFGTIKPSEATQNEEKKDNSFNS